MNIILSHYPSVELFIITGGSGFNPWTRRMNLGTTTVVPLSKAPKPQIALKERLVLRESSLNTNRLPKKKRKRKWTELCFLPEGRLWAPGRTRRGDEMLVEAFIAPGSWNMSLSSSSSANRDAFMICRQNRRRVLFWRQVSRSAALPVCGRGLQIYLEGVRVDPQRGRHVAGRRDAVVLCRDQTSELCAHRVHLPHQQVTVLLSSQHALGREALGNVGHVTVQLRHATREIHDNSGLKANIHTVRVSDKKKKGLMMSDMEVRQSKRQHHQWLVIFFVFCISKRTILTAFMDNTFNFCQTHCSPFQGYRSLLFEVMYFDCW